ncbi:putative ABC transporter permease protein YtcP [Paenibacillus sp. J23TS9]|uniref:carbohydrate ABC transporter permease n=1 Tax=Paenibacillus sp. J23TS9 TaxID=2807193 RepID=UPI001B00A9F4|nr:carbohydrate ABC transporter permease [Paenibacillus sp. J23TS9]GIP30131.1 putative ABC transporter permease protein YtcP [Paenibacillus sp. J23TS9]
MEQTLTRKKKISTYDVVVYIILGIMAIITFYPFYNVLIISFARFDVISKSNLYWLPKSFDFSAYKLIFGDGKFWNAFTVSVLVTVLGVAFSMIISVAGAYALSKKGMPGRNLLLTMILITMFFNGGLIPFYLIVKNLGLVNNILVMIVPAGINTLYLIIMKNYFNTIPEGLEESAKLDGANDFMILLRIIIPISAPFMATFALFYAVERWNEWWHALIFISDSAKAPLQIYLREVLITSNSSLNSMAMTLAEQKATTKVYTPSLQMATIIVSCIPIMLVYPFLQKHFAKGILVGSIKE